MKKEQKKKKQLETCNNKEVLRDLDGIKKCLDNMRIKIERLGHGCIVHDYNSFYLAVTLLIEDAKNNLRKS